MNFLRRFLQAFFVLLILGATGGVIWLLNLQKPVAEPQDRVTPPPIVRVIDLHAEAVQMRIPSQGNVAPHSEIDLLPQVSGAVIRRSPNLELGRFVQKGEELLAIDPRDYELAVVQREAEVAQAQANLTTAEADADVARREWEQMHPGEPADPLVLREPQLNRAKADLAAAKASLAKAVLDLERCRITAPFTARVRSRSADLGQYVRAGEAVARIYAVDFFEVHLPIPDGDLLFVDVPIAWQQDGPLRGGNGNHGENRYGPPVTLSATFGGETVSREAFVDRFSGEIDARTRQATLIARIEDPFGLREGKPPEGTGIPVGLFVTAEICGGTFEDVIQIPRNALRAGGEVLVVDAEDRLRIRKLDVLRRDRDTVYAIGGVAPGERICLTNLEVVIEGMKVRVFAEPEQTEAAK